VDELSFGQTQTKLTIMDEPKLNSQNQVWNKKINTKLTTELTMVVSFGTGIEWKNVFCPIIIHHLSWCGLVNTGFTPVNFWCVQNLLYYYLHGGKRDRASAHGSFLFGGYGGRFTPALLIQLHFCRDIYGFYQLPTRPKKKKKKKKTGVERVVNHVH
jgi:hypothetical protein